MVKYATVVMVLAHRNIDYILKLAHKNPTIFFVVHYDLKSELNLSEVNALKMPNLHFIENRISVYWAGYSQVQAVLALISYSLKNTSAKYFHLMSAECFPLIPFSKMEEQWSKNPNANYIESRIRNDNAWRVKTWLPHADSKHMRTFWGRVLKRMLRFSSQFINSSRINSDPYYGSLWFSISRNLADKIIEISNTTNYFKKFSRITCPDEHAFAIFVREYCIENVMDENKRYIVFPDGASNPSYLNLDEVIKANDSANRQFWFARKIKENIMLNKIKD